jgi:hypothetical protein
VRSRGRGDEFSRTARQTPALTAKQANYCGDQMDMRSGCSHWKPSRIARLIDAKSKKCLKNCREEGLILSEDSIKATLCHDSVACGSIASARVNFSWRGSARRVIFRFVRSSTARPLADAGVGIGI